MSNRIIVVYASLLYIVNSDISKTYIIGFELGNKKYFQFCGNSEQFQAASDFWEQEGVTYRYATGEYGESKLELTQRYCTEENDYMVPGGGSFSSQWRRQCIAWKLKVENDARSKPATAPADAAAAKRAAAAEKRARDALPEEDQRWLSFILECFGSKIDDTVNPTDQNADTQDDNVQNRTAEEMEAEEKEAEEKEAEENEAEENEAEENEAEEKEVSAS